MVEYSKSRVYCPALDTALARLEETVKDYRRAAAPVVNEESDTRTRGNRAAGDLVEGVQGTQEKASTDDGGRGVSVEDAPRPILRGKNR